MIWLYLQTLNNCVGSPSKASLVGAKTVIGPGRSRMSSRSASLSIDTNIEKSGLWARRSNTEHLSSELHVTDWGTLFCRLGGSTGRDGSIGCFRGAINGRRPALAVGGRSVNKLTVSAELSYYFSIKESTWRMNKLVGKQILSVICQFALTIYLHLVPEPEVVLVDELMELLFVL